MRFFAMPLVITALGLSALAGCSRFEAQPQGPYGYGNQGYGYGNQGYGPPPQQGQWGAPQQGPGQPDPFFQQVFRPVNVPALMAIQDRVPCAPKEVAPGTWAKFDCGPWQAMQNVIQYFPMQLPRFNFLPIGPQAAAVDHRTEGMEGPIRDQGAVGACTAMSLSATMDNAIRRMGRKDTVSALHVWSNYGTPVMGQAGDRNVNKSITAEGTWVYDPVKACKLLRSSMDTCTTAYGVSSGSESFDPALQAEHARADASGRYKVTSVEALHAKPANPAEIAGVLAGGDDVWISFSVDDRAWMSRNLQNAVIPDYETTEDTGHAVVLAGYRTMPNGTKQFLVHNSWGTRWGDNGYGWISEAMVTRFTRSAYRVHVGEGAPGAPSPAGPAPAPGGGSGKCPAGQMEIPGAGVCVPGMPGLGGGGAPSVPGAPSAPGGQPQQGGACPSGQARDVMSGQCAAACPGGGASVGGMCLPFGGGR